MKIEYLKWYKIEMHWSVYNLAFPMPMRSTREGRIYGLEVDMKYNTINLSSYIPIDRWSVARAATKGEETEINKLLGIYKPKLVIEAFDFWPIT